MSKQVIILQENDNVATAMAVIRKGEEIIKSPSSVMTLEDIPFGHKIAIQPIKKGAKVIKYGEPIGIAKNDIAIGACVHVHNLESERGRGDKGAK
ncbi:MAG: UxaA family hydrolase [Rhizobiaceae bacterium]